MPRRPHDDERPARTLWLTKGLGRGGTERLLLNAARCIDLTRFPVDVAYALPWKDHLVADLEASGIRVHCLGQRSAADVRWVWRLRHLVRRERYDIVHAHMPLPAVAARLALGGARGPAIVYTEHNVWSSHRWPTRVVDALTYRRNTSVIAVSQGVAATIAGIGCRPGSPEISVIHHGIDPASAHHGVAARRRAREILGLPLDAPVLGTVGNLSAKKDHKNLIAATALLLAEEPELRVVLVGEGALEADLRAEAERLGCESAVHFAGSRSDVPELMPAFDVFVLSSLYEGLPIALLEAMAAGVPCVATAVGGVPETVTDGVEGLLVPASDPQALASACGRLLSDDALRDRMGEASMAKARQHGIEPAVRQIEEVYRRTLSVREKAR